MTDLVEFLRARLDEDGQVALATIDVNIRAGMKRGKPVPRWIPEPGGSGVWDEATTMIVKHTWVREREHIVRHDPARVLREVEAKRRIVDRYEANPVNEWPLFPLLEMATVYADHPDYDERWKP